jgi:hypothetical protein
MSIKKRIIAAEYEIEAAKKGNFNLILPLLQGTHVPDNLSNCALEDDGWVHCDRPGWEPRAFIFSIGYEVGDTLFLAEPWTAKLQSSPKQELNLTADDMPYQIAQYWLKVQSIEIKQMHEVGPSTWVSAGLSNNAQWLDRYPEYLFESNRLVAVLGVAHANP